MFKNKVDKEDLVNPFPIADHAEDNYYLTESLLQKLEEENTRFAVTHKASGGRQVWISI